MEMKAWSVLSDGRRDVEHVYDIETMKGKKMCSACTSCSTIKLKMYLN